MSRRSSDLCIADMERAITLAREIERLGFKVYLRPPTRPARKVMLRPKRRILVRTLR